MNIGQLIEIYKMKEISQQKRASLIIKLGRAINHTMGMNITEPIVFELVTLLEPTNEILLDENFKNLAGELK